MYHSISDSKRNIYCISPQLFERQMDALSKLGYTTLTASELIDSWEKQKQLPRRSVLLTFDDGYEDNYTTAFPILKKHKMKATIFVVTGFVGKPHYLTWDEIKRMEESGLIDIESHTVHHPNLYKLSDQEQLQEFIQSKQTLEAKLHKRVRAFAYPYGSHNRSMAWKLKKAGYAVAFDSDRGLARLSQGVYALHRIEVVPDKPVAMLLAGGK